MGNHDVGRSMAQGAKLFWRMQGENPATKEETLAALDILAEEYRGADAEFDDEFFGETPLSKMVAVAFEATPEEIADRDNGDGDIWYQGPYSRFSARYQFC